MARQKMYRLKIVPEEILFFLFKRKNTLIGSFKEGEAGSKVLVHNI